MTNHIFTILISGIPGIGKSYLCNKLYDYIKNEDNNNKYICKIFNFDNESNINELNYFKFKDMRNEFNLKYDIALKESINNLITNNNSINYIFILDDNFYLKSMRKKIYNHFMEYNNNIICKNINFLYLEIFLRTNNLEFVYELNSKRQNVIPINIINKINENFEYDSPYIKEKNKLIYYIDNAEFLKNFDFKSELFNIQNNFILDKITENTINEENIKNNFAIFIDKLENNARKFISELIKNNEQLKKKGKEISIFKKKFMNEIYNINSNEINNELLYISDDLKNKIKTFLSVDYDKNKDKYEEDYELISSEILSFLSKLIFQN